MIDLSIPMPGIRTENWQKLYDSIKQSVGKYTFELIFCGPISNMKNSWIDFAPLNVSFLEDLGNPTRATMKAASNAKGKYITFAADDGWYLPNQLKEAIDIMETKDNKFSLVCRYLEGNDPYREENFRVGFHDPIRSQFYPDDYKVFGCNIMHNNYFKELGGLDCRFEALPMAYIDLGIRAQRDGCQVQIRPEPLFQCTHTPGPSGDHGPIHYAQIDHDQPLYKQIYSNPDCVNRIKIPLNNWKEAPSLWERRFNPDGSRKS